jgi:ABC-type lipoprotein release transport system permease subunit
MTRTPVHRRPCDIGVGTALVVAIGLIGSVYPAWRAMRVDLVTSLRAE